MLVTLFRVNSVPTIQLDFAPTGMIRLASRVAAMSQATSYMTAYVMVLLHVSNTTGLADPTIVIVESGDGASPCLLSHASALHLHHGFAAANPSIPLL